MYLHVSLFDPYQIPTQFMPIHAGMYWHANTYQHVLECIAIHTNTFPQYLACFVVCIVVCFNSVFARVIIQKLHK